MASKFSQHYCFFKQPSHDDPVLRRYFIQVINVVHQYDILQGNELLRHHLPIDEEREEAQETIRHVRWAEQTIDIPEVLDNACDEFKGEKDEEGGSDSKLYGDSSDSNPKEQFPESSERSTMHSFSNQLYGSVTYKDPDEPFQESETKKEEEFELPFPKRATTSDLLKENEEDFIVPFPHLQKWQREN
jgi:hypothetical protein